MTTDVTAFLRRFHDSPDVDSVFTKGCCYWFAVILTHRFPNSHIVYDPVLNHFAAKIDGRIFDITGDVTDKSASGWTAWDSYADLAHRRRIVRDCINF